MDKKNKLGNKGFMLLETLIVSTIILSTLIFLYIQFTNIKKGYDISFKYNTVSGLYMAKEISDFLVDSGTSNLSEQLDNSTTGYINIKGGELVLGDSEIYTNLISDMNIKAIIYTDDSEKLITLKEYISGDEAPADIFPEDFKKYIISIESTESSKARIII